MSEDSASSEAQADRLEDFSASGSKTVVVRVNNNDYEFDQEDIPKLKEFFEEVEIDE